MYSELYDAWQREIENPTLQPLPADFYTRISSYLLQIKEETRLPDKTVKANLMAREQRNVNRMVKELLRARYKKLLRNVRGGQNLLPGILTNEETEFFTGLLPAAEAFRAFARGLLQGQTPKQTPKPTAEPKAEVAPQKRVTLRFLKAIPSIIGSDMKTYGPFKTEDVASVPAENAKILVKQGLAQTVEVS